MTSQRYDPSKAARERYQRALKRKGEAGVAFLADEITRAQFDQVIRETYPELRTERGTDRLTSFGIERRRNEVGKRAAKGVR